MTNQQWELLRSKPIPRLNEAASAKVRGIPIEDNGEELVPASLMPEKILIRPRYFLEGLPHALSDCLVRKGVWQRLTRAAALLPQGFKLVLWDTFRPVTLQAHLFNTLASRYRTLYPEKDEQQITSMVSCFVARPSLDPAAPAPHNTGGAVDLTLADPKGCFVEMGTVYDDCTDKAGTRYFEERLEEGAELSGPEKRAAFNRRALYHVMVRAGFRNYCREWWHFDYGDQLWASTMPDHLAQTACYGAADPGFRWAED